MFFDPPPAREALTGPRHLALPAWFAPPAAELGVTVPVDRVLVHSANVAVALSTIRAHTTGCVLDVELALRQDGLSPGAFWDLHLSLFPALRVTADGDRLPDRLLRFGVRYADGTKATTIGDNLTLREEPAGPRLSSLPGGAAMRSGQDFGVQALALWLWPLPPAEPFEFAVEWPAGGIGLTITQLDGAPVVAAARHSAPYWPT